MKRFIAAVVLCTAVPSFAADDASVKEETCADVRAAAPDTAASFCLEQGEPAPARARALTFAEHQRRERIDARNADLWDGITKGDVVVVGKPALYALIAGGSAAVVVSIVLGGLAAAHKL